MTTAPHIDPRVSKPARTRRGRRLAILAGAVLVITVAVAIGLPRLLIVTETGEEPMALLLISGDRLSETAAEECTRNVELKLLLPGVRPPRLERLGIAGNHSAQAREDLERRGARPDQITILSGQAQTDREAIGQLSDWMTDHPSSTVSILCDATTSRRWRMVIDRAVPDLKSRILVRGLPDRRYSPQNWWMSRGGIRSFVLAALSLVTESLRGGAGPGSNDEWNPDEYERRLIEGKPVTPASHPGGASWLQAIGKWLDCGSQPRRVDHVLILPGDENTRPLVAAALVNANLAGDVLIPQNHPTPQIVDGEIPPTHVVIQAILEHRRVPREKMIVLSDPSDSTADDARAAIELLNKDPNATLAIVTSFYHTRRARMVFQSLFGSRADGFLYVSAPADGYSADDWWQSDMGTQSILSEYVKLAIYWTWYGHGLLWLSGAAFLLTTLVIVWRRRRRRATAYPLNAVPQAVPAV